MKTYKLIAVTLVCVIAFTGCHSSRNKDRTLPQAELQFPTRAGVTPASSIMVRGTASDNRGVSRVEVNGVLADTTDNYDSWSATVELVPGTNNISVDVTDRRGNVAVGAAEVAITRRIEIERPFGYEVDRATDTLYFVDLENQKLMTVALDTGDVGEFADISQFEPTGSVALPPLDIALDLSNDRVFLTVRGDEAIGPSSVGVWVYDIPTESWSAFSDSTIDPGAVLVNPGDLILDLPNNRLLALGFNIDAVVAISLTTGAQTILASNSVPDTSLAVWSEPIDAVLDINSNRLLMVDRVADAVFGIDLTTGAKSLITGQGTGSGPALRQPLSIAFDSRNNRALIFDRERREIIAVDLGTGIRSLFANNSGITDGTYLYDVRSLATNDGQLIALDGPMEHAIAFDLGTGERSVVTNNGFPRGETPPYFYSLSKFGDDIYGQTYYAIGKIAADNTHEALAGDLWGIESSMDVSGMTTNATGTMAYFTEWAYVDAIWQHHVSSLDLATGNVSVISDNTTPDALNSLLSVRDILHDAANNRLLVLEREQIVAVDVTSGARSVVSDDASIAFSSPRSFTLDSSNNRLLVADASHEHLIAVDLATGARTAFASTPVAGETVPENLYGISAELNGAFCALDNQERLISIDAQTGERTVLIDIGALDIPYADYWGGLTVANGLLYVNAYQGILEIDTESAQILKIYSTPASSGGGDT